MIPFYNPGKHQKTKLKRFLVFLVDVKCENSPEMS